MHIYIYIYFEVLTILLSCSRSPVYRGKVSSLKTGVPWGEALLAKRASLGDKVPTPLQLVAAVCFLLISSCSSVFE